jgi:hypothetical protein
MAGRFRFVWLGLRGRRRRRRSTVAIIMNCDQDVWHFIGWS